MSDSPQFELQDELETNFSTQRLLLFLIGLVVISTLGGVVLSLLIRGMGSGAFPGFLVVALAITLVAFFTFKILKGVQGLRSEGTALVSETTAPLLDTASDPLSQYYRSALGNTSANIMIANANNIIVYMNEAVSRLFKEHEEAIRKQLPDFKAQYLVGSSMDDFHKNPDHQRNLIQNLEQTYEAQADIADITFSIIANPIFDDSGQRLGTVVEWQDISDELAARRQAQENSRLSQALDSASANIMVADADNKIIYMNNTVRQMFRKAEDDIRQDLPHFNVDKLIGQSMDVFHKNPDHQRKLINTLKTTYTAPEARVANRVFKITASPMFEKDGARLGTVVEWQDISAELAVEHEINSIVESARHGDLGKRISTDDKSGFFMTLASGINDLVTVSDRIVTDTGRFLSALAQGDLRQRMEGDYKGAFEQLKKDANATVERLIEVLGDIQNSSQSVATGADEISKGNLNLSQRTEEQSASLEETAASMEQMTATVQQNAENAKLASTLAVEAKGQAEHGGEVVSNAITAMEEINDASQKIEAIISVIDEIAYQTNLLALNASVEAARAGEQGRGFAVVAEEVRSLAGRSAKAAKEIKELIENSSLKVKDGSTLVHSSGETLNEIIEAVGKVSSIISEISIASNEQATGIEEVNRAITQMDEITQQNAALVEESATAAQSMSDQAGDLRRLVEFFKMK